MAKDDPKPEYPTKVRYRLTATSYINGEVIVVNESDGQVFVEYDGHPGSALEPQDAEGKRRKAAYLALKRAPEAELTRRRKMLTAGEGDPMGELGLPPGVALPSILGHVPPATPPVPVEIPDDWRGTFNAGQRILLAAKLGAPDTVNTAPLANEFIEDEIKRRADLKAA